MSWSFADALRWLREADCAPRLQRADGAGFAHEAELETLRLTGASLDSRQSGPGLLFIGAPGQTVHGRDFLGAALARGAAGALLEAGRGDAIAWVEGDARPVLLVDDARTALAILCRRYLERAKAEVVGITGSNGKTTTKDLLRAALKDRLRVGSNPGNLNSRWGLPLAVLGQSGDESVLVLEMGASEPGEIGELAAMTRPRAGCITNVAPAHLAQFKDLRGVLNTKAQLIEALPPDGLCVLYRDDANFDELRRRSAAERVLSFGVSAGADLRLSRCEQREDGLEVEINGSATTLPIFGKANGLNVAAACALASRFDVAIEHALTAMRDATLSPHRSRIVRIAGRTLLDDCYNANPSSMGAALASLAEMPVRGRRIAALGSMRELGADSPRLHEQTLGRARELGVGPILVVGEEMSEAARRVGVGEPVSRDDLAENLCQLSRPGDAILFKASRGIGLERAMDALIERLSPEGS
jgi:UDP-N-acetylmuramoyl-tripeptide--D-alanyl-D-alanine ligase